MINTLNGIYTKYGEETMIQAELALDKYLSEDVAGWTELVPGSTGQEHKELTTIIMAIAGRIRQENAKHECKYAITNSDKRIICGYIYTRENRVQEYADTIPAMRVTVLRDLKYKVSSVELFYDTMHIKTCKTLGDFANYIQNN